MVRLSNVLLGIVAVTTIALYTLGTIGELPVMIALAIFVLYFPLKVAYVVVSAKLALMGYFGDKQRWLTELVNERDEEFVAAIHSLSRMQIKEEMVIAESKRELRKRVIARSDDIE